MKLKRENVKGFEIKRRTFESKTDSTKNDNALTSKYMPSYKYWLRIDYDSYSAEYCRPTKAECLADVETAKRRAGTEL